MNTYILLNTGNARVCWFALWLALALSACGSGYGQTAGGVPSKCTILRDGVSLFVGSRECLGTLPRTEMSGYWVVGHEYSVIYPNRASIKPEYDRDATWLELSPEAYKAVKAHLRGTHQIFEVRFIGTKSVGPGLYGWGGFKSAALMMQLKEFKEIPRD